MSWRCSHVITFDYLQYINYSRCLKLLLCSQLYEFISAYLAILLLMAVDVYFPFP